MPKPRGPHRDAETKREIVREIRAGDLTQAAAARRLRVSRQSIRRWMVRAGSLRPVSRFVAVDLTPPPTPPIPLVAIGLARGRTLRVPLDVTADDLGRLVRVLESAC